MDDIKLVVWDFDDTLCFHSYHGSPKDEFETEYNVGVLTGADVYSDCKPNQFIKEFMDLAKQRGMDRK